MAAIQLFEWWPIKVSRLASLASALMLAVADPSLGRRRPTGHAPRAPRRGSGTRAADRRSTRCLRRSPSPLRTTASPCDPSKTSALGVTCAVSPVPLVSRLPLLFLQTDRIQEESGRRLLRRRRGVSAVTALPLQTTGCLIESASLEFDVLWLGAVLCTLGLDTIARSLHAMHSKALHALAFHARRAEPISLRIVWRRDGYTRGGVGGSAQPSHRRITPLMCHAPWRP